MEQQYEVSINLKLNGKDIVLEKFMGAIGEEYMIRGPQWQELMNAIEAVNSSCRKIEAAGCVLEHINYE